MTKRMKIRNGLEYIMNNSSFNLCDIAVMMHKAHTAIVKDVCCDYIADSLKTAKSGDISELLGNLNALVRGEHDNRTVIMNDQLCRKCADVLDARNYMKWSA